MRSHVMVYDHSKERLRPFQKLPFQEISKKLRSFLGLIKYKAKFIPKLSTQLQPLNALLQVETKWRWSSACQKAFRKVKKQIASAKVLTHYDPTLPIKLAADASAYGVDAVISHKYLMELKDLQLLSHAH